ncbi:MAG TPA: serine hydrolase domain-containing protein, partial [Candidatus Aquilonibacter sp.]
MQISRIPAALFAAVLLGVTASPAPSSSFFQTVGRDALRTGVAPGLAVAVALHGAIVYEGGFGEADVSKHIPAAAHTPFAIGSLTKQFTAAAILLLAREHRVALDDPLSKYVPSLPNASGITIRMLLNQTSGLHNYPLLSEHAWPTRGDIPLAKIVAILATDPTDFKPGTKWAYSNANYAALAAVVEKAGGEPFGVFLQKHIFGPLNMKDSGFGYTAQRRGNVAVGYANGAPEQPALSLDLYSGAGGVVASADDLARWDISLMRASLLPQPMIAQMWNTGRLIGG